MDKDSMRNKVDMKFYCSKHPETELNFSTDLSKIGASSAHEINIKIVIHPCERCQQEIDKIKNAISLIVNIDKKQ